MNRSLTTRELASLKHLLRWADATIELLTPVSMDPPCDARALELAANQADRCRESIGRYLAILEGPKREGAPEPLGIMVDADES